MNVLIWRQLLIYSIERERLERELEELIYPDFFEDEANKNETS